MKENWIVYHLTALDYAKSKVEQKEKEIEDALKITKNKSNALNDIKELFRWYKNQVEYHRRVL